MKKCQLAAKGQIRTRTRRTLLLAGSSALAIEVGLAAALMIAEPSPVAAQTVSITTSTVGSFVYNSALAAFSVSSGGSIAPSSGYAIKVNSAGSIGVITNDGTISGSSGAIQNRGTIGTLSSSGTIIDVHPASLDIFNSGGIGVITNAGLISAVDTDIFNTGSIGTLSNSGTIIGNRAIFNSGSGSIGVITNSGVIAGSIVNATANGLTIDGGSGSVFGTLTGNAANTAGTITSTLSNLTFASGNLLLNDDIYVGGNTVTNTGATIALNSVRTITGNYAQNAGGLSLDGDGELVVTGIASIGNGSQISLSSTGNYIAGQSRTLIHAGTLSGSASVASLTGLAVQTVTSGTDFGVSYQNDYIGGSLAGLLNSSSIGGHAYGLYVAASGSLGNLVNNGTLAGGVAGIANAGTIGGGFTGIANAGTIFSLSNSGTISGVTVISNTGSIGVITNSGVIAGNIGNNSANGLTINGGSNGTFGTLTGYAANTAGTITSTRANLTFGSGNLWLNDDINVGAYSVINSGAMLKLSNSRTISGSYSQTGGGLVIGVASAASYGNLSVTNSATVTGSAITISGVSLTSGETFSIVRAGTSGTYSNDSVTVAGGSGLTASVTTIGNTLVVTLVAGDRSSTSTSTSPTSSSSSSSSGGAYAALGRAAGGAAVGVGTALDAITASTSGTALAFQTNVLVPLNTLAGSEQAAAVKQLAPSQITPLTQVAAQTEPVVQAVETHQLTLAEGGGAAGAAAGSASHPYGLWGQMLGGFALRGATAGADGAKSSSFGLMSGLDFHADADTTVGAAVSWLRGWSAGLGASSGSFTTADSYQLTAYGLHRFGPAFIDGQAGIGYDSFNQRRSIAFLGQRAHADYDGQHYLVKIGGGYDIPVDNVTLTPTAGLRYLRAVSDGYRESGSAGDLTVHRRGSQSLTQDLGVKVGWSVATPIGTLRPEAHLAWVHDYAQGPIATSGLIGGEAFTSTVSRTAADGARLTLSATLEQSDSLALKAEYEGETRPSYQSHSGLLKVIWGF